MSAALPPQWLTQALTDVGAVASGARLYSYVSGTSIEAPLYADEAGTTPHDWPLVFSAAGRPPAFFIAYDVAYRFVLKTGAEVTLTEVDPVKHPDIGSIPGLAEVLAGLQPLDSDLTAIADLATTAYGRSLLTQADAAALRANLGTPNGSGLGLQVARWLDADTIGGSPGLVILVDAAGVTRALVVGATSSGGTTAVAIDGPAGQRREFQLRTNGLARAILKLAADPESGGNQGSSIVLAAYSDEGAPIDEILRVARPAASPCVWSRPQRWSTMAGSGSAVPLLDSSGLATRGSAEAVRSAIGAQANRGYSTLNGAQSLTAIASGTKRLHWSNASGSIVLPAPTAGASLVITIITSSSHSIVTHDDTSRIVVGGTINSSVITRGHAMYYLEATADYWFLTLSI